jgi:DNA-binding GntR family transcriptional regulator
MDTELETPDLESVAEPGRKGRLYGAAVAELRRLCESLGISRTPLREAIRTLGTEGLVTLLPNRGAVVSELDVREVAELYQVVCSLVVLAADLAMARITDEQIAEIGMLHYRLVRHQLRGELDAYFEANQAIHRALVEISGNSVLLSVWDMLALRVNRARYMTNLRPERWAQATREHEAIFAAIRERDRPRVCELLANHIMSGLKAIEGERLSASPAASGTSA